jgi:hypothetical protein
MVRARLDSAGNLAGPAGETDPGRRPGPQQGKHKLTGPGVTASETSDDLRRPRVNLSCNARKDLSSNVPSPARRDHPSSRPRF